MRNRLVSVFAVAVIFAISAGVQAQPFVESFETNIPVAPNGPPGTTITLPSGDWFALNESNPIGATGVFSSTLLTPTPPGGGAQHAAMNFNNGSGLSNISTFFMSPVRTLNNGDQISFFTRTVATPAFPDRLRLRLSTNGASTNSADFSTILLTVNDGLNLTDYPNVWTQFSATLSGLPGGGVSGRFAFHYDVPGGGPSGANSDFIGIDLASYTPVPEPTSLALVGVGATGLIWRRWRKKAAA
jgi:hypothetical protein